MLYIHCTARMAKATSISLEAAQPPEKHFWLDCWYVSLFPLDNGKCLFPFTNPHSLFSIVILEVRRNPTFFGVVAKFRQRLADVLVDACDSMEDIAAATEGQDQYMTCKTASRSALGSMNDMALFIGDYVNENNRINTDDIEKILNEIPQRPIGYQQPMMKFGELAMEL